MFIKAEVLLTRQCSLSCSYCRMKRKPSTDISIDTWKKVLSRLREWDVRFLAIYGAEPTEYPCFFSFLSLVKDLGWGKANTVITAGHNPGIIHTGIKMGLIDSVTMSWDFSKTKKDNLAMSLGKSIRNKISDLEISATIFENITKEQIDQMMDAVDSLDAWLSFDLKHMNTSGHTWSKVPKDCQRTDKNDVVIEHLLYLKREGRKIHQTELAIEKCLSHEPLWNCTQPFFMTVNCDGVAMVCDDFGYSEKRVDLWKSENEFRDWWGAEAKKCIGCKWTTHVMSEEMFNQEGVSHFCHGR